MQCNSSLEQSTRAADYSFVRDQILDDHCRAAKVLPKAIVPMLNAQQITELREHADKMYPFSRIRQEFMDAAKQGEQALHQRGADKAARQREAEQARANDLASRSREQSASQDTTRHDRSDRDSYSSGR